MTGTAQHVFIVDDDPPVRESLRVLLEASDYSVKTYGSARYFLAELENAQGCLITDIRMPEMTGLDLQEELNRRGVTMPVIMITGHGDVGLAVRAMKAGAMDFIEKPFDDQLLLTSLKRAFEIGRRARDRASEVRSAREVLARLTPRELDVLNLLVKGHPNKIAAFELGISPRTIEIHRSNIMDKTNAQSLSDLVRISIMANEAGFSTEH